MANKGKQAEKKNTTKKVASNTAKKGKQAEQTETKLSFADWDIKYARTNPLEDFHVADALINARKELPAKDKADFEKHMELRGTGGCELVNDTRTNQGTKRAADEAAEASTQKVSRLTGQSDATQQRALQEVEVTTDEPRASSVTTSRSAKARPRRGTQASLPAKQPEEQDQIAEQRPTPVWRDSELADADWGFVQFTMVGPKVADLSTRPALYPPIPNETIPRQFVFEKDLTNKNLYRPSYKYDDVATWWKKERLEMEKGDLKIRQLMLYKIIGLGRHGTQCNLDLDGDRIDEAEKIYKPLNTLIKNYDFEEYSEYEDKYLESNQEPKPKKKGRQAQNRFEKFLKERRKLFENHPILYKQEKAETSGDADLEEEVGRKEVPVRTSVKVSIAERKRRIVIRNGLPFIERNDPETGDRWYEKVEEQEDVEMTDAADPTDTRQINADSISARQGLVDLTDLDELITNLDEREVAQDDLGTTIAAEAEELGHDLDSEDSEAEQLKRAKARAKGFRRENRKRAGAKRRKRA